MRSGPCRKGRVVRRVQAVVVKNIHDSQRVDIHKALADFEGEPGGFVDEAVGQAEKSGFERSRARADDSRRGALHQLMGVALADFHRKSLRHPAHALTPRFTCRRGLEANIWTILCQQAGRFQHHRKIPFHLALPAAGKKAQEVWIAFHP